MATTPRGKLSIDRRAASTLVAFESLTKRTPRDFSGRLHHVRADHESRRAHRSWPPAEHPASAAAAVAASTLLSMWRPVSSTAASWNRRSARVAVRLTIHSPSTTKPSGNATGQWELHFPCGDSAAVRHHHGIVCVDDGPVVLGLIGEDARLGGCVRIRCSDVDPGGRRRSSATQRSRGGMSIVASS